MPKNHRVHGGFITMPFLAVYSRPDGVFCPASIYYRPPCLSCLYGVFGEKLHNFADFMPVFTELKKIKKM